MRALSDLYEVWLDLDLAALPERVEAVEALLIDERHQLSTHTTGRIGYQLEFLRRLTDGDRNSLLVCFYVLGQHYQQIGRHDFAALLYYRTIEGCLVHRLEQRAPGFSCEKPDYALLTGDVEALLERYRNVLEGLGKRGASRLPYDIGLMSAGVLLTALDDRLVTVAHLSGKRALSHLEHVAGLRNRSVLAHGYQPIAPDECGMLDGKAKQVLRAYWSLYGADRDVGELCRQLRFVQTDR
jgi:hypothetical protein